MIIINVFIISLILSIKGVRAVLELGRLDKIIFNSSFPNTPANELIVSPCSFTLKNAGTISNIYVIIGTPPPSHFGCLRKRVTYSLLSRNSASIRTISDFPCFEYDPQLQIPLTEFCSIDFWRITPDTIEIYNRIQKGLSSNLIEYTMNLNLIRKNSNDVPLYLDITVQVDMSKLIPMAGTYGATYHYNTYTNLYPTTFKATKCPLGAWIRYLSSSSVTVTNGTGAIPVIYMSNFNAICTDETGLSVSSQVKFTDPQDMFVFSAKPFTTECNLPNSFPVAGYQIGIDNSVGNARFICSNKLDTPWIFKTVIPNEESTKTFMCPNGYLANGFITYSGFIIHGFGLQCGPVPLKWNVTEVNSIDLVGTDMAILLTNDMMNMSIGLGSRRDIWISLTQTSNFPLIKIEKLDKTEWKSVTNFTFGDVLDSMVRVSFPTGYFENGHKLSFNMNIRSFIRHQIDNIEFAFLVTRTDASSMQSTNIGR